MTAVRHPGLSPQDLPARRLLVALAASLCMHYLMVSEWGGDAGGVTPVVMAPAALQARLDTLSVVTPPIIEPVGPEITDSPLRAARLPQAAPPIAAQPKARLTATAAKSGADSRFYQARELDQYPVPLSMPTLARDQVVAGDMRLWVSIDHTGQVVDVAVIDAEAAGEYGQLARARVLATRFVPARRDGLPVKSRVLLVLNTGADAGGR